MTGIGIFPGDDGAPSSSARPPRLRVAILATPRSGNTWVRSLLGTLYGLRDVVCDRPNEVPWDSLPERCVLQLHWSAERELSVRLQEHDVRAVTIARHPLDGLISMLHFCTTWPGTSRWFGGRGGNEDAIRGAMPTSGEFQTYAVGPRARTLLSITADWWQVADCHKLFYERLVSDPVVELERLSHFLEPANPEAVQATVTANSFDRLRPRAQNQHYWMGNPGHWKRLLPAPEAKHLADAHAETFKRLGYVCDPDERLTAAEAERNWMGLEILSMRQELINTRAQLFDVRARLEEVEALLDGTRPASVRVAQRLHALAASHPRLYESLALCLRPFRRRAG